MSFVAEQWKRADALKLVFFGTPEAAVPPLHGLIRHDHEVQLVVTQADKRRGRGPSTTPSPVKAAALELGLPVSHTVDDVLATDAELGVVVAFGRLIKPHVLERIPMVNLHFSLLPRWRGAAPVERAILAGDAETGVCLMQLEEGLDTGPVYAVERTPISEEETAEELRNRLVDIGTRLLVEQLASGLGDPAPQEGEVTYAEKLTPEDFHLNWSLPAEDVHRRVRAGRAWTMFRGKRFIVTKARLAGETPAAPGAVDGVVVGCGDGRGVELVEVQPEGKPAMAAVAWRNGAQPSVDERLGG